MIQAPKTFSRRTALAAAGALGMAGILSACGLSGDKVFSGEHEGIIVGSAAFFRLMVSPRGERTLSKTHERIHGEGEKRYEQGCDEHARVVAHGEPVEEVPAEGSAAQVGDDGRGCDDLHECGAEPAEHHVGGERDFEAGQNLPFGQAFGRGLRPRGLPARRRGLQGLRRAGVPPQ